MGASLELCDIMYYVVRFTRYGLPQQPTALQLLVARAQSARIPIFVYVGIGTELQLVSDTASKLYYE